MSKPHPKPPIRLLPLTITRSELHLPSPPTKSTPWGAILEFPVSGSTITVVALGDSTTSVYFGPEQAMIGGGDHESIRNAGSAFLKEMALHTTEMLPADSMDEPQANEVVFYARTDRGLLRLKTDMNELRKGSTLAGLFEKGQDVITQFRLYQQAHPNG